MLASSRKPCGGGDVLRADMESAPTDGGGVSGRPGTAGDKILCGIFPYYAEYGILDRFVQKPYLTERKALA